MEDLSKVSLVNLKQKLSDLLEELEELEEEKSFVLKQTGLHVSGGKVKQYQAQTDNLTKAIDQVQAEIKRRG